MSKKTLILSLMIGFCAFLVACNLNPFKSSSDDSSAISSSSSAKDGSFGSSEVQEFLSSLSQSEEMPTFTLNAPAYSFYRFEVNSPAGGLRLATILSYDQAASQPTYGLEDTAKVLLFEAMKKKAGYSIDYFSFISKVASESIDAVQQAILKSASNIEFVTKSEKSLEFEPSVADSLSIAIRDIQLPPQANFVATPIDKPALSMSPQPKFPSIDATVAIRLGLTEEAQRLSKSFATDGIANSPFFKSNIPITQPASIRGGNRLFDDSYRGWNAYAYYSALSSFTEKVSISFLSHTNTGLTLDTSESNSGLSIKLDMQDFPDSLLDIRWTSEVACQEIELHHFRSGKDACCPCCAPMNYRKYGSRIATYSINDKAYPSVSVIECSVIKNNTPVSNFNLKIGSSVEKFISLLPSEVATLSCFVASPLTKDKLRDINIDLTRKHLELYTPQTFGQYVLYDDEVRKEFEKAGLNEVVLADWVKLYGNPNFTYNISNIATFSAERYLIKQFSLTKYTISLSDPTITSNGGNDNAAISINENTTPVTTITANHTGSNQTITYSISGGTDQSKFSINSTSGVMAFQAAPDFEVPADSDGNNTYVVQVTANDGNSGTDKQTITVTVIDVAENTAPIITSNGGNDTTAISINENTTAVTTVAANDSDSGQTITYSISGGTDQNKFNINLTSGVLAFQTAPDFEAPADSDSNNTYVVQVTANDGNSGTDIQTITVTVIDVAEGPSEVNSSITNQEAGSIDSKVTTLTITVRSSLDKAVTGLLATEFSAKIDGGAAEIFNSGHFSSFTEVGMGVYKVKFTGIANKNNYNLSELTVANVIVQAGQVVVKTPPSKILHYTFEDNVLDSTTYGNHGIANNLTYVSGKTGKGIQLNGTNGYLAIPNSIYKSLSTLTMIMSFKTTARGVLTGYQKGAVETGTSQFVPILYVAATGKLYCNLWTGSATSISSSAVVNDGLWHKAALSVGQNSISLYLDDNLIGTKVVSVDHLDMVDNQIGTGYITSSWPEGTNSWDYFNGVVDDCYLLNGDTTIDAINNL